jgi:hypothetical protein
MVFAVACPPRETNKLLKHPETLSLMRPALKLAETLHGISEMDSHGTAFSRPTG